MHNVEIKIEHPSDISMKPDGNVLFPEVSKGVELMSVESKPAEKIAAND